MIDPLASHEQPPLQDHEIEVKIQSVALNFRDVLNAMGLYPGQSGPLGADFCGKIQRCGKGVTNLEIGQSVFGLTPGAFQNRVIASKELVVPKPPELTITEAASIPIVFLTTYYALIKLANLQRHDKILIHSAAGRIGLAAIQIATQVGAEVFATVGSARKKRYLESLGVKNIFSSRSLDFVSQLQDSPITVVLNSLTGDGFIQGSLATCAPHARFLELGKLNIWTKGQMAKERLDIEYFIVAIDELRKNDPDKIQALLKEIVPLFEKKQWMPLPKTLFSLTQIKSAFQHLQQAKQIGKVVIKFPNEWKDNLATGTYLITGGLGSLGLKTAEWLISQGVRHLVLIGKNASQFSQDKLEHHRKNGITISIRTCDISQADQVALLFKSLNGPPLKRDYPCCRALI